MGGHEAIALRHFRTLLSAGTAAGLTDGQLLERFLIRQGEVAEAAFTALVVRHGPMVWRICQKTLRDPHDAEDAFQATFLVLVRRAGSIRSRDSVESWLYGVARRVAACARSAMHRRCVHERRMAECMPESTGDECSDDMVPVVREEIAGLPEEYRSPIVLCDLEGMTHEEAAVRLQCPVGTIKSRLSRGRARLRGRLARRGVAPAAGAAAVGGIGAEASVARPPEALVISTVRAAMRLAAGDAMSAGMVPATVITLIEGATRGMFLIKLKAGAAALVGIVLAVAGTVVLAHPGQADPGQAADGSAGPVAEGSLRPTSGAKAEPGPSPEVREMLRQAARIAATSDDSPQKVEVLRDIAAAQAKIGDRPEARATYRLAIEAALALQDSNQTGIDQSIALRQVATSQARAGLIDDALLTVKVIRDPHESLSAQGEIAMARASAGDFDGARRLILGIADEGRVAPLLADLAAAQAEAGHAEDARHWAGDLTSPAAKSRVLLGIARGISKRNKGHG